jgi:hypothetical protein
MRTWIVGSLALVLTIGILPAQAIEPLALYDDFHGTRLDPPKWVADQSEGLPLFGLQDAVREVILGRLRLGANSYANPTRSISPRWRAVFTASPRVTAIDATLMVTRAEAVGCASNTAAVTQANARLSGFFFNTAPTGPTAGSLNDVLAFVRVERWSDSTDPEYVLQVHGYVLRCNDPDCNATDSLGTVSLGTVHLWQPVRLLIQWDQANHRFIFQRDRQAAVYAPYTVPDTLPSLMPVKRVEIAHRVPNCSDVPPPHALMELLVDKVLVNQSAVPLP